MEDSKRDKTRYVAKTLRSESCFETLGRVSDIATSTSYIAVTDLDEQMGGSCREQARC